MPNWCEGVLRIKGKWENLIRFLKEGLESPSVHFLNETIINDTLIRIDEYEDGSGVEVEIKNDAHIKGTRRGFICSCWDDFCKRTKCDYDVMCFNSKFAWTIQAEQLAEISKQFEIDFRIHAYEKGMEFCRYIEIIGGKITKDEVLTFDDYEWDCNDPLKGG